MARPSEDLTNELKVYMSDRVKNEIHAIRRAGRFPSASRAALFLLEQALFGSSESLPRLLVHNSPSNRITRAETHS